MNTHIKEYLSNLQFGEPQNYDRISIIPLHTAVNGAPAYIGLAEAMASKTLTITEVSEGGSVPQLLVLNDSDQPVLIIDGEELIGAKQNRILNTSILLKERSRTVVPVSCTEQGRWTYSSAKFAMSDAVLERKIRSRKSRSVSQSLMHDSKAQSDQGEVWDGIHALHCKANFSSPTSALHDVYKARAAKLDECMRAFPCTEGQSGLLVVIKGVVAGIDLVSRSEVYARLHEKLIRSYVLDALLEQTTGAGALPDAVALARTFIGALETSQERAFPSVGYGEDHRYEAPSLTGSALVHSGRVIHAAFLSLDPIQSHRDQGTLSSLRQRRNFRQYLE